MISLSPLISVIVPYYNSRFDYFKEAIESVLAQSYTNWEAIIVNDGSSGESTRELINLLDKIQDKRFKVVEHKVNAGVSFAKRSGIEASSGEIITVLDTDDMHFPWYYQEIIDFFSNNPKYLIIASPSYEHIKTKRGKNIFLGEFENKLINEPHRVAFHNFKFPKVLSCEEKEIYNLLARKIALKLFINATPRLALKKEVFQKISFDQQFTTNEDSDLCLQILNNEDLLNKTYITLNPYYLHRIFSSKARLTQNPLLVFENMTKLKDKYSDKNSIASKSLWQLDRRDEWLFDSIIYNHLSGAPLLKTIRDTMSTSNSKRGKIKSLWKVLKLIIKYQLITQILGIDYREYRISRSRSIDKTKDIEKCFTKHLRNIENHGAKTYVNETYEAIFN